jgi:hypothetical protein
MNDKIGPEDRVGPGGPAGVEVRPRLGWPSSG